MPSPKHPDDRVRRNKDGYDENGYRLPVNKVTRPTERKIVLPEWDGVRRGPDLWPHPEGDTWHRRTQLWWNTWRDSSQAMFCSALDWEILFVGALVHHKLMLGVSPTAMVGLTGELRKLQGQFGASIEDRIRLNMQSETEDDVAEEVEVKRDARKIVNYLERLNAEAADRSE